MGTITKKVGEYTLEFVDKSLGGLGNEIHVSKGGELRWVLPIGIIKDKAFLGDLEAHGRGSEKETILEMRALESFMVKTLQKKGIIEIEGKTHAVFARALKKKGWEAKIRKEGYIRVKRNLSHHRK